jgi:alpha-methylacyl-CoA racemase
VLSFDEAPTHPHNIARGTFAKVNGVAQPAPAPKFGGTPAPDCKPVRAAGADTRRLLAEFGFEDATARLLHTNTAWTEAPG